MPATAEQIRRIEADPLTWRLTLFEPYLTDTTGAIVPDGPHHRRYWTWLWDIAKGSRPKPMVNVWPRGGAKSTNAELGTVAVGARGRRRYAFYVCGTQDLADDHVATIGEMLESPRLATFYPDMARRRVGKYGTSKGWRRTRLRTAAGFTIDAVGLDTAARGVKLDEDRPDWLIFDDIDEKHDSANTVQKKIETITASLIPAGSEDRAILFIQNLIHPGSVFAQLASDSPPFLTNRILNGPVPALEDFTYATKRDRVVITSGTPTWVGQDRDRCQADIDEIGITAFLAEAQHEVAAPAGGMFSHLDMAVLRIAPEDVPPLTRVVCWVDPAVTKSDQSDAHAIQIDGIHGDTRTGTIYRLYSWEQRATPLESLKKAILKAVEFGARYVGIETDQGGETWDSVFREAKNLVYEEAIARGAPASELDSIRGMRMADRKAGQGDQPKVHRASLMLTDYEKPGLIIRHVIGTHTVLERALDRYPKTKPLDLVDAGFYSWDDLRNAPQIAAFNPDAETAEEGGRRRPDDPYAAERQSRIW